MVLIPPVHPLKLPAQTAVFRDCLLLREKIKFDEVPTFSEIFAVGTAACLVPVRSITRRSTRQKFSFGAAQTAPGPLCEALSKKLDAVMRGQATDSFNWGYAIGGKEQATEEDRSELSRLVSERVSTSGEIDKMSA